MKEIFKDSSLIPQFETKLFDIIDKIVTDNHCENIDDVINYIDNNALNSLIANTELEVSLNDFKEYIRINYRNVIKDSLSIHNHKDNFHFPLKDFANQSSIFRLKFNKILFDVVKRIINKDSYIDYLEDMDIKPTYENIRAIDMVNVIDYFGYDIAEELKQHIDIPDEVINDENFDLDVVEMVDHLSGMSRYYFKVWNDVLLPLTKEKIKFLSDPNFDKIGDEHILDIDTFDSMNRDNAFIIINKKMYIGNQYDEHADISDNLIRKNIKDKGKIVMYGHIINDIAFVDLDRTINSTPGMLDDLRTIIKKEPSVQKAYTMPKNKKIRRLAKILYKTR